MAMCKSDADEYCKNAFENAKKKNMPRNVERKNDCLLKSLHAQLTACTL